MQTKSTTTRPAPTETPATPFIFEWYTNKIQRDLQELYREDVKQRQMIVEVIEEMTDSNLFWRLISSYDDAVMERGEAGSEEKHNLLMALLARVYIAGTCRGGRLLF